MQLSVLKELHQKGFVYVDIKTDNIMIGNASSEHQVSWECSAQHLL